MAASLSSLCAPASAQLGLTAEEAAEVAQTLEDLGLEDVLAAHLRSRLRVADADERLEVADRLGRVYARRLAEADDPDERMEIARLSEELLQQVPAAESNGLRLSLIRARYLPAEQEAERARLLLSEDEDETEALSTLREIATDLLVISTRLEQDVRRDEQRLRGGGRDPDELRADLAESQRLRSLAQYYLGWSSYYAALLGENDNEAREALQAFAALLGSDTRRPSLDRLPRSLLRYEHVARSSIGTALCHALLGEHATAIRWLDELEASPDLNDSAKAQIFSRRMIVLASAGRWDTLVGVVQRKRGTDAGASRRPLSVEEARLLGVEVLTATEDDQTPASRQLVRYAMADLVAADQIGQVLDLSRRFGTLPLGEGGFIPAYVRAIRIYEDAREAHGRAGDLDLPVIDLAVRAAYRRAADLFEQAYTTEDAEEFTAERGRCGIRSALCASARGEYKLAVERLERVFADQASAAAEAQEAIWLAIELADRGVALASGSGRVETERLTTLQELFLRTYPLEERSVQLILTTGGIGDPALTRRALEGVAPNAPLYSAAQRRLASILYRAYRTAGPESQDNAASELIEVARRVLALNLQELELGAIEVERLARSTILTARQLLDASLGRPGTPDLDAANQAIAAIDAVFVRLGGRPGWVGADLDEELAFRRVQIAWAQGETASVMEQVERLTASDSAFASSAVRFLYNRAVERRNRAPDDLEAARLVVRWGMPIVEDERTTESSRLGVAAAVATAAVLLSERESDPEMRAMAVEMGQLLFERKAADASMLRMLAELAEIEGDPALALRSWQRLLALERAGSNGWFEARYESLRLLMDVDLFAAREAFRQHVVLHPELGPEFIRERYEALARALGIEVEPNG
ncbi:MAG: hypothetical protein AAGI17_04465 [Planctomycetota bacterium]